MSSQAERIGIWVLTNLGLPDEPADATIEIVMDALGRSSIPEALETVGDAIRAADREA